MKNISNIIVKISLSPMEIIDVNQNIEDKIKRNIVNKHIENVGVVIKFISIVNIEELLLEKSGNLTTNVSCKVEVYSLLVGEVLSSIVSETSFNGYYLDEPIQVFVKGGKNIGDKVKVKINSVIFSLGKFIVSAVEV